MTSQPPKDPSILGDSPERRIHRRVQLQFEPQSVVYAELGGGQFGIVTNISEGGLGMQTVSPVMKDDLPNISFRLPPTGNLIRPTAQVAWKTVSKKVVGVRFLSMSPAESAQLRGWINAQLPREIRNRGAGTLAASTDKEQAASPADRHASDRFDHLQQPTSERNPRQRVGRKWARRAVATIFTIVLVTYVIAFWKRMPWTAFGGLRTLSDWRTAIDSVPNVPTPLLWSALVIFWIGVAFAARGLLRKDRQDKK